MPSSLTTGFSLFHARYSNGFHKKQVEIKKPLGCPSGFLFGNQLKASSSFYLSYADVRHQFRGGRFPEEQAQSVPERHYGHFG
jgi:hypothetical protein